MYLTGTWEICVVTNLLKFSMFNLQEASVSLVGNGVFGMMKVKLFILYFLGI